MRTDQLPVADGRRAARQDGPRVMVVDDDPAVVRLIRLILRDEGIELQAAVEGRDALARLEDAAPDVIVLDLEMPGMNGRSFYRELRARGANVPVLILSAFGARSARRELSADAYLEKPFRSEEFLAAVKALLQP